MWILLTKASVNFPSPSFSFSQWNEPISLLQRVAEYMNYAYLLKMAAAQKVRFILLWSINVSIMSISGVMLCLCRRNQMTTAKVSKYQIHAAFLSLVLLLPTPSSTFTTDIICECPPIPKLDNLVCRRTKESPAQIILGVFLHCRTLRRV